MSTIAQTIEEIAGDFALLSDWEDRYSYLIELGRALPPLAAPERVDANKVRGCASQVWLVTERTPEPTGALVFRGDSDAHIVRGLIAVIIRIFSNRTPQEILATDPRQSFAALGLSEALTPQRSNGVYAMMERMRRDAQAALTNG